MKLKIKIKTPFGKFKAGAGINVAANDKGVPLDKFWRNRLRDSKVDNCIEVVKDADSTVEKMSAQKRENKKPVKEEK